MSNLTKFTEALQADPSLRGRVEAIDSPTAEENAVQLAAIANEAGFAITAEEFLAADQSGELAPDQLDLVSGGFRLKNDRYYPATNPGMIHHIDP
jgi:predicted ribosomally synthesized peptide with nif11-like leader